MDTHNDDRSRTAAFMALLIEDVIAARERLATARTQTARRDVVRSSLAAIEGMTWVAREHVRIALDELDELTPIADLALREISYSISENGKLNEQTRPVPLLAAIRFVVSQAKVLVPELSVDFSGTSWSNLRRAVDIRNRITHPKPDQDLAISDNDLAVVGSSVSWLLATVEFVMAGMNLALTHYNDLARDLVQRLISGDPEALAEYHAAVREIEGD
ncbi:MAG: hypothetical protein ACXW27_11175 [Allosphingosinicella sp.]